MGSIQGVDPAAPAATIDQPESTAQPGTVIGPYQLIEQIGEGGMGTVWMAWQTEPVKRLVALKPSGPKAADLTQRETVDHRR